MNQATPQVIVVKSEKNIGLAIILALLFGPFGLFYSSVVGGIVMLVLGGGFVLITLGFGMFITWPVCIFWAWKAASDYNRILHASASVAPAG
ncbi:MAG TPA: hypothetical protein VKC60_12910 [Opitutaceae bacterium]|nr:hypothetical protein [Opitutaceae bacterium]